LHLDLLWSIDEWKFNQHSTGPSRLEPKSLPTWSWTSATSAKASVILYMENMDFIWNLSIYGKIWKIMDLWEIMNSWKFIMEVIENGM
ncbi:MAG: hypothetical protein Q8787_02860, partial [Sweet potato little leaf phytoplasma]|nr:hypothetical protein [Sweet potato little leaf phytoplasma]